MVRDNILFTVSLKDLVVVQMQMQVLELVFYLFSVAYSIINYSYFFKLFINYINTNGTP